jgi:hypothetical protein
MHALDLVKQGQCDAAHHIVQEHLDRLSCLIHAYLHNVEGDTVNAQYWYTRAGEQIPNHSHEKELDRLYELARSEKIT